MDPISSWLLISWVLKKLFDHKDRYMTEEQYRLLWDAQESKKLLYGGEPIKLLPRPEEV